MWFVHGIRKGLMYGYYKTHRLLNNRVLPGPTAGNLRANIRGMTCSCRMPSRECRSMNALHVRAQQEVAFIYTNTRFAKTFCKGLGFNSINYGIGVITLQELHRLNVQLEL